jgi:hypothetical protein
MPNQLGTYVIVPSAEEPKRSRNSYYMLKAGTKAKVSMATVAINRTIHSMAKSPTD